MKRRPVRCVALAAMIPILAVAFPVLGSVPTAAAADSVVCADRYPAPVLTGYGVMSQTACDGPTTHGVERTCNLIFGTWNGKSDWVPNGGGSDPCNSNGPLLDFGPCAPGTWMYRTISVLDGVFVGFGTSEPVAIHC